MQGDRGPVMLRVADPFEMVRFRIRTGDGKVTQLTERNPRSRMVFLGYQYTAVRQPLDALGPARVRGARGIVGRARGLAGAGLTAARW